MHLRPEIRLLGLDVIGNFLQFCEGVDFVGRFDLCAVHLRIFLQDGFVVDDSVGLDHICDALDRALVVLQFKILGGKVLVQIAVLQIQAVILPGSKSDRTVDLEQCRCVALGHFRFQCLLIGSGCRRRHRYGNARLVRVGLGKCHPLVCLLRFEVEVINLALAACCRGCGRCFCCCRGACRRGRGRCRLGCLCLTRCRCCRCRRRTAASCQHGSRHNRCQADRR